MKWILLSIIVILLLLFSCIYLFIPNKIIVSGKIKIAANQEALFRNLSNANSWGKWWPGEKKNNGSNGIFSLNGLQYKLVDKKILSLPITISNQNFGAITELSFISINTDSTNIVLSGVIPISKSPIKRIKTFFTVNKIKENINTLLQSINAYYSKVENLYGYAIQEKSVVDSTLISTFKEVKGYPSTEIIYSIIDELKNYINQHATNETGYPMLNIFTEDGINYRVKVAIPVDKKLPSSGNISYKWMLGGGNILITEVHGGNSEIQKAFSQVQNYISDYKRTAPAISFLSLVTDRRKEPDSSKWITRIYYPVI